MIITALLIVLAYSYGNITAWHCLHDDRKNNAPESPWQVVMVLAWLASPIMIFVDRKRRRDDLIEKKIQKRNELLAALAKQEEKPVIITERIGNVIPISLAKKKVSATHHRW